MKQTALAQLEIFINEMISIQELRNGESLECIHIPSLLHKIKELKPIERQQIEYAFLEGYCKPENSLSDSKDYFNNTLTQD
jgi:hypothetical protein